MEKKDQSFEKKSIQEEFLNYYTSYYGSEICILGPTSGESIYSQFLNDMNRNNQNYIYIENDSCLFREQLGMGANDIGTSDAGQHKADLMAFIKPVKNNLKHIFDKYIKGTMVNSDEFVEFFLSHWHQGGMANYIRAKLALLFTNEFYANKLVIKPTSNNKIDHPIKTIPTNYGMLIEDSSKIEIFRIHKSDGYENVANVNAKYVIFFNNLINPKIIHLSQQHEILQTSVDQDPLVQSLKSTLKNLDFNITKDLEIFIAPNIKQALSKNNMLTNYKSMSLIFNSYEELLMMCQRKQPKHRYTIQLQQDLLDYQIKLAQMINTNNYNELNNVIDSLYSKIEKILARILNNKNFMELMNNDNDKKTGFFSIFAGKSDFASIIEDLQTRLNKNKDLLYKNTPFLR